ncbi:MAG: glycosyltransferase family A protein [Pseudomonadota bacterium]
MPPGSYAVISPCRNECKLIGRTLDSMLAQTHKPQRWVIVDDGSTDETPSILADYASRVPWITVVTRRDRGHRAVGPGVVEAFYDGLDHVDLDAVEQIAKLDLDLDLPPRYFEILCTRLSETPRHGAVSGKPYARDAAGRLVSERRGDEMSVGMTKLWRVDCFRDIGGIVRAVMWDAIDCHTARMKGWAPRSWDEPELRFEHLRPMGSSQSGIHEGRRRHGRGQWYMGSDPLFYLATCLFRMTERPYVTGGLAMLAGYLGAAVTGAPRHPDAPLRAFIRRFQRRALLVGKRRAVEAIEAERAHLWRQNTAGASA